MQISKESFSYHNQVILLIYAVSLRVDIDSCYVRKQFYQRRSQIGKFGTRQCEIRVTRGSNGHASIWVDIGESQQRYIEFRNGEPITSEAGLEVIYDKSGDLYLIRMGGVERYEVPEAVVYGG